jgi:exopolyphosphatase / guanosine-5'-triphosphate,3'-diphosphate pyrophosphatase
VSRVAAIDCGTNSIRLLVADIDPDAGTLRDVTRTMQIVRLGQGVDRTGRFSDEALARTFAACESYSAEVGASGAARLRFCATSAARDAANAERFAAGVRLRLGVEPEVITGEEEARLSYTGATRELSGRGLPTPYLVFDIGGGSTEFVLGDGAGEVLAAESLDIGSVRMTERHLGGDPPTPAEVDAARADIRSALTALEIPLDRTATLVGVAGTVTTVTAMALGLDRYDPGRIHLSTLPATAVTECAARLLGMRRAERAALPYMHPGRADVIGAGALIFAEVVALVAPALPVPAVLVSEHDILDGIAWSIA